MTNKNLPIRKSPRAQWHPYDGAEYFVTICTHERRYYFGNIVDGEMQLSEIGKYIQTQIEATETLREGHVSIPLYCIMPNHIHMIVIIWPSPKHKANNNISINEYRDAFDTSDIGINIADARSASLQNRLSTISCRYASNASANNFGPQKQNLGSIVRGIKSAVTRYANEHQIKFRWQTRYHDHIIRNQQEMNQIAEYIKNNPLRWELDCFHPGNETIIL